MPSRKRGRTFRVAAALPPAPLSARVAVIAGVAIAAALIWTYWPVFVRLATGWSSNAQYSHGYLVPLFAGVLVWLKRKELAALPWTPSVWGLPLVLLGSGLLVVGGRVYFGWFEEISLLPVLAGLCVLFLGWKALRLLWPAIAFLAFMIPLPFRAEKALAEPLQTIAATASTFTLQTLGFPALREGNVILVNENQIGVVEACNGLSMMMVFFALAVGMVMLIDRPWPDKLAIVVSAFPIAIIANVIRIVVTGVLFETVGGEAAKTFFHDFAGWIMMPLALGLLWLELKLISWLFVQVDAARPLVVGFKDVDRPRGEKVLQPRA